MIKKYLVAFFIIFSVCIFALLQKPTQYSISLYYQVPLFAKFFALLFITSSVIQSNRTKNKILFYIPIYIIFLTIIQLPYLLGYAGRYGDTMVKLGNSKDLLAGEALTVGYPALDKYPLLHHEGIILSIINGHPPDTVFKYLFLVFLIIGITGVISLSIRSSVPVSSTLLFVPLIIYYSLRTLTPSSFAYLTTVPILLLVLSRLLEKNNYNRWVFIFTVLSVALWLQHLMVAIIFFILLVIISIVLYNAKGLILSRIIIIYAVFGYVWVEYGWRDLLSMGLLTGAQLFGIYHLREQSASIPGGGGFAYLFNEVGATIPGLIYAFLLNYGSVLILFTLSTLGIVYLVKYDYTAVDEVGPLVLTTTFLIGVVWAIGELIIGLVPAIHWRRVIRFSLIPAPILAGLITDQLHQSNITASYNMRLYCKIIINIVLVVGLLFTGMGVYSSPEKFSGNSYVVDSEIKGWEWFISYKNPEHPTLSLGRNSYHFEELILSPIEEKHWINRDQPTYYTPAHYNFSSINKLQKVEQSYHLSDKRSIIMNTEIGNTQHFSKNEISDRRFRNSNTDVIYSNGYQNISIIHLGASDLMSTNQSARRP